MQKQPKPVVQSASPETPQGHSLPAVGDEMRRYLEEQRGKPLIRVGAGYMFGSGN